MCNIATITEYFMLQLSNEEIEKGLIHDKT
jgi:hypothetical protein